MFDGYSRCEVHKEVITEVRLLVDEDVSCFIKDTPAAKRAWSGPPLVFVGAASSRSSSSQGRAPVDRSEWAPPGGVQGACRSATCDMPTSHPTQCFGCYPGCNARNAHDCNGIEDACSLGAFEAFAGVDQARCQELCEADETCRAYEFNIAGVGSGKPCELHYSDVTYTVHHGSPFRCYLKPSSGKRARSLLLGS
jgi:hypothetical protein